MAPFIHLRTLRHKEGDLPMVSKPVSDGAGTLISHLAWAGASSLASTAKAAFFPSYAPSPRNTAVPCSLGMEAVMCQGRRWAPTPQTPGDPVVPAGRWTVGASLGSAGQGASFTRSPRRNRPLRPLGLIPVVVTGQRSGLQGSKPKICRPAGLGLPLVCVVSEYVRTH